MDNDSRLRKLPGWELTRGELRREFTFKNFADAFGFMTKVAAAAEKLNHHPDWSNSYNRVVIRLSSHDAGTVTDKDYELAAHISELAEA
jgi:4a-hydroxytetrahydrobiopterin dehydratase